MSQTAGICSLSSPNLYRTQIEFLGVTVVCLSFNDMISKLINSYYNKDASFICTSSGQDVVAADLENCGIKTGDTVTWETLYSCEVKYIVNTTYYEQGRYMGLIISFSSLTPKVINHSTNILTSNATEVNSEVIRAKKC